MSKISYVFPIYNEEGNISLLYKRMKEVISQRPDLSFEFLFVNDGSTDASIGLLRELKSHDTNVKVLDFSRNFGHQAAVTAGLDHASGDAVIVMDSDLQDPPEVSLELIAKWEEGYDVVYAQRRSRQDSWFKKATANAYYRVLSRLSDIKIPRNVGDFRLMDRVVVNEFNAMREHNRFIRGMVSFVGFEQAAVPFDRDARFAGETGYPLRKMVNFALDGVFSFSTMPIKTISRFGYVVSCFAFLFAVYIFLGKLINPESVVQGWSLVTVAIFSSGVYSLSFWER